MVESLREFVERVGGKPEYRAEPWYNEAGDCIEYHFEPDEHYADRVDSVLTVYRSLQTDDIVGCQVKGITALHQMLGNFGLTFKAEGKVRLAILILGSFRRGTASRYDENQRRQVYQDLEGRMGSRLAQEVCFT